MNSTSHGLILLICETFKILLTIFASSIHDEIWSSNKVIVNSCFAFNYKSCVYIYS